VSKKRILKKGGEKKRRSEFLQAEGEKKEDSSSGRAWEKSERILVSNERGKKGRQSIKHQGREGGDSSINVPNVKKGNLGASIFFRRVSKGEKKRQGEKEGYDSQLGRKGGGKGKKVFST